MLPWVSRELYDAKCEELRRSEEERRGLLDRLLASKGVDPLTAVTALAEVLPAAGTKEVEELVDPVSGQLTIGKVVAFAEAEAKAGRVKVGR